MEAILVLAIKLAATAPMDPDHITVAIIDENPESRQRLVRLFENEPGISVEAVAETVAEGMRAVAEKKPDVILVVGKEPFTEGLESTSAVVARFPDTRVIVLSRQPNHSVAASCCIGWACYFLCEGCSDSEIIAVIRGAHYAEKENRSCFALQSSLN